ncbi:MAG TPA: alternative ribosome rescue aminoacyl-tRNA hydrolase ArfB [Stellaceae bacterium]|nr:alternative ribosome rescue aminoacyl-tRNA hydrolase ArfB [Stellaceae bacterium]
MIRITPRIAIGEQEIEESFIRASGPGGQNVNKVSSAVQIRFDVRRSPSLPEDVRARLEALAGQRLTQEGVLVITAQRHRSQALNRADAIERLTDLIRRAAERPAVRRPTRPTLGSKRRRLEAKSRSGAIKALRGRPRTDGE